MDADRHGLIRGCPSHPSFPCPWFQCFCLVGATYRGFRMHEREEAAEGSGEIGSSVLRAPLAASSRSFEWELKQGALVHFLGTVCSGILRPRKVPALIPNSASRVPSKVGIANTLYTCTMKMMPNTIVKASIWNR
jgi:hypothetical protein